MLRLPRVFMDDHAERELPTPTIIRATKTHYYVADDDAALPELLSDARYYADPSGAPDDRGLLGIKASARATVRAILR